MHSFAMTENYVVLVRQPLVYKMLPVLRTGKFQDAFRRHPERGTRYDVIDRPTGNLQGSYQGDPVFYWHQINAFEQDGQILLDLIASDRPDSLWDLDLVKLRDPAHRPLFYGDMRRFRIPITTRGPVTDERLADVRAEFPTINYARNHTRDYQFTYAPERLPTVAALRLIVSRRTDPHSRRPGRTAPPCVQPGYHSHPPEGQAMRSTR